MRCAVLFLRAAGASWGASILFLPGSMRAFDVLTRAAFAIAALALMLLACGLIAYAASGVWTSYRAPDQDIGSTLLDAVGFTIIAIAVFDVGKYLLEEEAIRGREMRNASEARRSMTKFISTIIIAILLEALVTVFQVGKEAPPLMVYPTLLLLVGVLLIVGLGVYQRLSVSVESEARDPHEDRRTLTEGSADEEPEDNGPEAERAARRAADSLR